MLKNMMRLAQMPKAQMQRLYFHQTVRPLAHNRWLPRTQPGVLWHPRTCKDFSSDGRQNEETPSTSEGREFDAMDFPEVAQETLAEPDAAEAATSSQQIYEQTNIYDEDFKQELMGFCHFYQIPFLDSNIPKTTKNAAKIYYRILQDGKRVIDKYQHSLLVKYLASIPQELIDDQFNPEKMGEKWRKFFG